MSTDNRAADLLEQLAERILAADTPEQVRDLILAAGLAPAQGQQLLQTMRVAAFAWPPDAPPDYLRNAWRTAWATAVVAPGPLAALLHTLGRAFNETGRYTEAIEPLLGARLAYQQADDREGWARITNNLASSYYSLGQYEPAERCARQALEHFRADPQQPWAEAGCWLTLANILADRQQANQAIEAFRQSIAAHRRAARPDVVRIASALVGIGRVLEEQCDDFIGAAEQFSQAHAIYTQQLDGNWRRTFTLQLNRAILALRLGRHAEARHFLTLAGQALDESQTNDQFDILIYQAYQDLLLGRKAQARLYLTQAFRILEINIDLGQIPQTSDLQQDKQISDALFFFVLMSSSTSTALPLLAWIEQTYQQLGLKLAPGVLAMERARIYYSSGSYTLARTALAQAKTIFEQSNPNNPPIHRLLELEVIRSEYDPDITLPELQQIEQQVAQFSDPNQLLPVLFRIGSLQEQQDPEHAKSTYHQAVQTLVQASGLSRLSVQTTLILQRVRYPFERIFALSSGSAPEEAHMAAEQARVQILLDDLLNDRLDSVTADTHDDPLIINFQQARERLNMARARINLLAPRYIPTNTRSSSSETSSALRTAQIAYDQARQNLLARSLVYKDSSYIKEAEHYTETQALIDEHTLILSYFLVGPAQKSPDNTGQPRELWVSMLRKEGKPQIRRVLKQLEADIFQKEWHSKYQTITTASNDIDTINELLNDITEQILAPIWPVIRQFQKLIVVPDDRFPLLPFHALRPDGRTYLIETHTVSYAPSTTILSFCRKREQQREPGRAALVAGWESEGSTWLRHVRRELRAVAQLLETAPQQGPLRIRDMQEQLSAARIIHLACHGFFPSDEEDTHPRFARLELGGDDLYAYDLYGMRLRADLFTLSACETAQAGVGLQGLFSAGLAAGASSVVASLWQADDPTTPELMHHFYTNLIAHRLGRAEALRQAQRTLAHTHGSPAIWAAFLLIGVPDPLPEPALP